MASESSLSSGGDEDQQPSLLLIQRQTVQSKEPEETDSDLPADSWARNPSVASERNTQATPEQEYPDSESETPQRFQIAPIHPQAENGSPRPVEVSETTPGTEIPNPWWQQLFSYFKGDGKKQYSQLNKLGQNTEEREEQWIAAILLRAKGATAILIINVILMIIAGILAAEGKSKFISGVHLDALSPAFYQGDCSTSGHLSTALHLLISILSTGLLMCSNFAMQCLSAPSRADTDAAHLKRKSLEVGTSSGLQNFLVMDWRRKILWLLLLVTSTPIHLIYNSAVFTSIATQDYGVVVVPNNYSENDSLVNTAVAEDAFQDFVGYNASDIHNAMFNGSLQNLTAKQCLERYAVNYNTVGATVVAYMDADHNNILQSNSSRSLRALYGGNGGNYRWICASSGFCGLQASPSKLNFFVQPTFWVYPNRTFTLPKYDGQYQTFDSATLDDYSSGLNVLELGEYVMDSPNDWVYDMFTFFKYIIQHNPTDQELRSFMKDNSTSIWRNQTWAGDVSFNTVGPTDNGTLISMMAAAAEDYYESEEADYSQTYEVDAIMPWNVSISYCQSQPVIPRCQARFSIVICLIVLICNGIKVACIFLAARRTRKDIFLTTGDALSSFLCRPDVATKDKCLMYSPTGGRRSWTHTLSRVENWRRLVSGRKQIQSPNKAAIPMTSRGDATQRRAPLFPDAKMPKTKRWFQAATWSQWTIVLIYLASCLAIGPFLAASASTSGGGGLAGGGFGTMNPNSMSVTYGKSFYSLVLLSNSPQIVLTILYFFVNGLFTSMLAAAEYNNYATERKTLRVSWPMGEQRSTYRLSLPYRYSIALMLISTLLHWLLTNSFFLVLINNFDVHGQLNLTNSELTVSFSVIPMIITCVVLGASLAGVLLISLRRFKSNMPLLTTNFSYGLSAACHPPVDDTDAAFQPVQWGEIPGSEYADQDDISERGADMFTRNAHCSFSSREVNLPSRTVIYV
ncbi:hypothetical protein N7540_006464 [Penicillium herquei]|nr:hypothetical protein N7540_006464 [Penicillium herquei]